MKALVPPNDLDAESAILGAMMMNTSACDLVLDKLAADDFYRPGHGLIFTTIAAIRSTGREPDALSVAARMTERDLKDAGGREYIHTLMEFTPSAANAVHYAEIVASTATRRKLIRCGQEIVDEAYNNPDAEFDTDFAETKVLSVSGGRTQGDAPIAITGLLHNAEARIYDASKGKRLCGRPTHFQGLNDLIGGLEPGMSFILAARPSLGKSAMAMNIASIVSVDVPVLFFSVEMSKEELVDRLLASTSGVGLSKLRAGNLTEDEAGRLFNATHSLAKLNLSIDDTATSMSAIVRKVRRFASKTPPGLIVIDYLQLLAEDRGRESRNIEVGNISRSIKLMAREHRVPVMTLSQLNRPDTRYQSDDGTQQKPTLASLRDSGSIEQDADCVAFIHRKHLEDNDNIELIVAKARNGQTGTVRMSFTPHLLTFSERMN